MAGILGLLMSGAGLIKDQYFNLTTLLLPGNGTNGAQNNTFLDSSSNNFTITRNGNTTQGTFSPFSQTGWGNYFDGNGTTTTNTDSLSIADNTALELSNVDFTIESWVYLTADLTTTVRICDKDNGTAISYLFYLTTTKALGFQFSTDGSTTTTLTSSGTIALNVWNHVAITRSGNNFTFWINGGSQGVSTNNVTIYNSSANLIIGNTANINIPNQRAFPGYISNFRIVKGVAVYTGNFTPPTSPLERTQSAGTNISAITGTQTSLLTCQSNRFIDNSSNAFAITVNGNTSVVAFSPFAPTAAYTAAAVGGSGYFDGTGDKLTLATTSALSFGTNNWTIEFWVYRTDSNESIIYDGRSTEPQVSPHIQINPSGVALFYVNGAARITGTTVIGNGWFHIAVSKLSGSTRLFVNGAQEGSTYSDSNNYTIGATLYIGGDYGGSANAYLNGYLSDLRVLNGTGYSTITVPTAPLTAITNTSLLLNFTNAGITDATAKNDLETVGNAQISTTQSKWGGGSIYLDGTGDYLNTLSTWAISGSEAYTLEAWIYPTTVSGDLCIYETRSSSGTGFVLFINSTGKLQVYDSTGLLQTASTTTLTANTWTYIAMVRSAGSSTNTFYVNGTSAGTFTLASFATATNARIGARNDGVAAYNGYMQDFRITKGYARTITASPTAAFPTL